VTESPWQTHASRTAYENRWIRVREDQVTMPDGRPGVYGVVEVRNPAVFVVAMTEADEVVLIELFRYTVGRLSLEVPAGGTDGEDPLVAAQRELLEETGLVAAEWQHLASTFALNGVCDAPEHVFLARGLRPGGRDARAEEGITAVRTVPWPDVLELLRTGGISDGETAAALMFAALALGRVS
jgi:8-oxo-dGTP pyrophosphatase MutT (NUDIX family)